MSLSGHDRRPRRLLDPPPYLAERYFASKGIPTPHTEPDAPEPEQLALLNPGPTWTEIMECGEPDPGHAQGRKLLAKGPAWEGTDKRITILSCGLGQDSTALALMVAKGDYGMDRFRAEGAEDLVVAFYDTGAEWDFSYALIPRIAQMLGDVGVPFYVLEKPPIELFFTDPDKTWAHHRPGETLEQAADRGRFHNEPDLLHSYYWGATLAIRDNRSCTSKLKIAPSRSFMDALDRERIGLDNTRRGHLVRKGLAPRNRVLIGICSDESERAHHAEKPWYEASEYPLLDAGITKDQAVAYLRDNGWGDVWKSGCDACPFQRKGWYWMLRELDPVRFAMVEKYERVARRRNPRLFIVGDDQLHREVSSWRSRNGSETIEGVRERGYDRLNAWGADEAAGTPVTMGCGEQTSLFLNPGVARASAAERKAFDRRYGAVDQNRVREVEEAEAAGRHDDAKWLREYVEREYSPRDITYRYDDRPFAELDIERLLTLPGARGEHKHFDGSSTKGRFSEARLDELAQSIRTEGFRPDEYIMVIVEADGRAQLWEGNHRLRAAKRAGLATIPVEWQFSGGSERLPSVPHPADYYTGPPHAALVQTGRQRAADALDSVMATWRSE